MDKIDATFDAILNEYRYSPGRRLYQLIGFLVLIGLSYWLMAPKEPKPLGIRIFLAVILAAPAVDFFVTVRSPKAFQVSPALIEARYYIQPAARWRREDLSLADTRVWPALFGASAVLGPNGRVAFLVWPSLENFDRFMREIKGEAVTL